MICCGFSLPAGRDFSPGVPWAVCCWQYFHSPWRLRYSAALCQRYWAMPQSEKKQRLRHALPGLAVLALLLVVLACVLAALYPPTEKFSPGSRPLREFTRGMVLVLVLLPLGFMVSIFLGCNLAGAYF
jgi:hypothetical protein